MSRAGGSSYKNTKERQWLAKMNIGGKPQKRSKGCLYMPNMKCTHPECIKVNGEV